MKERMKCLCCGKIKKVLVLVLTENDSFYSQGKEGVCQDCIKNKDIEETISESKIGKIKAKIKEEKEFIENAEADIIEKEEELKKLGGETE